jgi:Ion channel
MVRRDEYDEDHHRKTNEERDSSGAGGMTISAIAGLLIISNVLWEAFETIVLPRRVTRPFRVTVVFYRFTWIPWRAIAHGIQKKKRRETFLGFYGPLSLLCLFMFWAASLTVGFALLFYSASRSSAALPSFASRLYLSGTTLFTLGIGDVVPHTATERFLVVFESGLGLGFLALVLSYLPVIYQAFSRREVNIVLLDARAGSPPTAAELLRRHSGPHGADELEVLLHDWERSAAEILESHISYPAVCYFRSQHNNESWIAALTTILDSCALLIASVENACARQARLTFAICRHTTVDLAQLFRAAPRNAHLDRLPPEELQRMRTMLATAGFTLREDEASTKKLKELRELYEPYLQGLSEFLFMEIPPWILSRDVVDNWRTSAWGRIAGFSSSVRSDGDDH